MRITKSNRPGVAIWGGLESTINRVGEQYFDQCVWNGHDDRPGDLQLFADLGVKTIRYPVLWEKVAPHRLDEQYWERSDERLQRLQELGIRPIVGLLHHGSGPRYTSLVDDEFPEKLAEFASAVARRYPWVDAYTPVNEPLTTARFSGLYGHWYPHGTDSETFLKALLNQCRGISLAMRAIRKVNSQAELVQTEDLGRTFSTPLLEYQARFENHRHWLSLDLLCGRVTNRHPLWKYLKRFVYLERKIRWFEDNPTPPDIVGVNHYPTSDRFLDERLSLYPKCYHGGNFRHQYADVQAPLVLAQGAMEVGPLVKETWERCGLPVAVTEAHIGDTRDEQIRWLKEVWTVCNQLHDTGVDVRAVTAWALLGSYDWNSLVTKPTGYYEPGVFDVRSGTPRLTAIGRVVRILADGRECDHPVTFQVGWWRRAGRLLGSRKNACEPVSLSLARSKIECRPERTLLITGGGGRLAEAFAQACSVRNIPHIVVARADTDLDNERRVRALLSDVRPWAIVNAAGDVPDDGDGRRGDAEGTVDEAEAALVLAKASRDLRIGLLSFSTDLVFGGRAGAPHLEDETVAPRCVFGRIKARAEKIILETAPQALVMRLGPLFGPSGGVGLVEDALSALAQGLDFRWPHNALVTPSYLPDVANVGLDLVIDGETGVLHAFNREVLPMRELLLRVADKLGLATKRLFRVLRVDDRTPVCQEQPWNRALGSTRGHFLPSLEEALRDYAEHHFRSGTPSVRGIEPISSLGLQS